MAKLFPVFFIVSLLYASVSPAQRSETAFPGSSSIAPSQNATGIFSSVPVNLSTGTVQISVPLAAIQGYNMQIPVSLGYQSSGIRVKDVAGPAGLGWSLNSGGIITRIVRDKPDDALEFNPAANNNYSTKGYAGNNMAIRGRGHELKLALSSDPLSRDYSDNIKKFEKNKWDSEPDLYYFNFMGRSGQFFLNENKVPILVPQQDLKINLIFLNSTIDPTQQTHYTWVITTSDGTSFVFGDANQPPPNVRLCEVTEFKTETPAIATCIPEETTTVTFASSWYLQRILSPTGNVEAEFEYETGANLVYSDRVQLIYNLVKYTDGTSGCYMPPVDPNDQNGHQAEVVHTTTIKKPLYLSRIHAPASGNEMSFIYANKREGETEVRILDALTVRNQSGETLKRITFSYSFFGNTPTTRRLRLDRVQDGSTPPYQFHYNQQENTLPERNSFQVDYWGYYNGKAGNKHGIPSCRYVGEGMPWFVRNDPAHAPNYNDVTPYEKPGADLSPDPVKMQACILTRITYPTGGWVGYTYGCHQYFNSVTKKNEPWGGLRIEQVTTSDGVNEANNIVTRYAYSRESNATQSSGSVDPSYISGKTGKYSHDLYHRPMVVTDRTKSSFFERALAQQIGLAIIEKINESLKASYYLIRSSQAANTATEICYQTVTVQQTGKGRAVHTFTSFFDADYRDPLPELYYTANRSQPADQSYTGGGNGFVLNYMNKASRRWCRGLLKETWTFDEAGRKKTWRQVNYKFLEETDANKMLTGLVFYAGEVLNKDAEYGFASFSFFGKYVETPQWLYVDNVTERVYDQNDDTKFSETVTNHEYNFNNLQVAATRTSDGSGKTIIKRFKYAVDYPDIADDLDPNSYPLRIPGLRDRKAVVNEMLQRHMTGIPLEVQTWQQIDGGEEKLLSVSLNEFQFIPRPEGYPWYQFTAQLGVTLGAVGAQLKRTLLVPKRTLQLYTLAPISVAPAPTTTYQFSTLNTAGQLSFDAARFTEEVTINRYDTKGNGLEAQGANRPASCTLLGNNTTLVIAKVSNASYDRVAYTSFEAYGDQGNWSYTGTRMDEAKTGLQSFSGGNVTSKENLSGGKYKVSFWYKGSGVNVNGNAVPASSEWRYHEQLLTDPGQVTVSAATAQLDELRLHPAESFMTSYTYRPGVGALSVTDVDGVIQYYEYDDMQRLKLVRDSNQKIVKSYFYHYKQ